MKIGNNLEDTFDRNTLNESTSSGKGKKRSLNKDLYVNNYTKDMIF